ncbi:solute carrier family 25 (mitochondrial carnitine/acylcarnitine transporter), member 20/29 [Strigomonas culicis]|uniref:ADP/ATP translocase n=1 Tax=Strigomonas culicis TaxID=28005 RepID=S9WCU5_9TRYP|nr:solute carrier family 25 (mitochondrial carnitine/acylcarnitine transporter), member 20/29 [Strigomonas culicis]EPY34135.1 solute carrier family 25 (mitochondrial carnitine/acylcarnitine transporter), member 20/29 [Strigomonas culicis]|eukprot:EPY33895.1 solute carrier family 25 (mitochondrial carnitine/acylcarnitine transporter), member 20/29 [Strigomonas culicis]
MVLTAVEGELVRQGRLPPAGFGGVCAIFQRIWRKEGWAGLLRGVLTDFVFALPAGLVDALASNSVFMLLQAVIPQQHAQSMGVAEVLLLSMVATGAAVYVASPYNGVRKTVTTNYVADIVAPTAEPKEQKEAEGDAEAPLVEEAYRYGTSTEAAARLAKKGGWRIFYRGATLDPFIIMTYRGLYIAASMLVPETVQVAHPYLVARGLALVADVVSQPLEVLSRRLVLTASDEVNAPYDGAIDCARQIAAKEGVTALWAGLRFRIVVSFVTMGLRAAIGALVFGSEGQS